MLELLRSSGHICAWAVSSSSDRKDVAVHRSLPPGPSGVELVLLAVPDKRIEPVAEEIAGKWSKGCSGVVFLHFSGLLTSSVLQPLASLGAHTGSLHPLQSIVDAQGARQALAESVFTFEGSPVARKAAQSVADSLGVRMVDIRPEDKLLYHTSAVIASNYLVALLDEASAVAGRIGLDRAHLMGLVRGTLANIERLGGAALTGPVSRGDWDTVRMHVDALERCFPDILPSYLALGWYTSRMARRGFPPEIGQRPCPIGIEDLAGRIDAMRDRGMKIVFTNGCFDILHKGHVSYLEGARRLGDCLVVGLNSDASVRRLKGPSRPVNPVDARCRVLGALACVDYVVVFEEDTPYELISRIRPDVLVKGGDWSGRDIVGSDVVQSYGGRVVTLAFEEGYSTSWIIERIRKD